MAARLVRGAGCRRGHRLSLWPGCRGFYHLHRRWTHGGAIRGREPRSPRCPDWLGGADAEIAAAARDYFAYCGTYEFHDDTVVHRVEVSLIPNWMGGEQVRHVVLDGDTITLSTPPGPIGGRQQAASLVWQRV